jgi:signal transduction histidine kinase
MMEGLVAVSEIDAEGVPVLDRDLPDPRYQQPLSGWYWQIAGPEGPVARSRSLWDQDLVLPPLDDLEAHHFEVAGPNGERLRVVARAFVLPGAHGPFVYAVGAATAAMEADVREFTTILVWALVLLGTGLVTGVWLQVRYGLRPLRQIETELAAIRSGLLSKLDTDVPREIRPLAQEVNALLVHSADVLARARTQAGNLAHALKTPLAVLRNAAQEDVQNRTEHLAAAVMRQVTRMQQQIDRHLARARTAAATRVLGATARVRPVAEGLERTLARLYAERQVAISLDVPTDLAFRGEQEDLEEMLGNLLDNACKWGHRKVLLVARGEGDRLCVTVEDDGPGLDGEARAVVLEWGRRLDESVPGTGLGLAIVRDMAELYGGTLELASSSLGGLAARLTLPLAR